jgi:tetratricopeptide (TPR) repeat protein
VKLGLSTAVDLPPAYEIAKEALESEDIGYEDFLKRNSGFTNPTNVSQLAAELGMSTRVDSLFDSMRRGCPEAEMAASIRKKQSASWAFGHVASGIRHFKSGNNMEAFQCLNQALKIDEENVEGLVARGALFANNGSLEKAVVDFEMALKHNPTHRNATKYHSETLVAVARRLESEKKVEEAIKTYIKILHRVPDHKEASESLRNLRSVTGNFSGLDPSKPWETREKLRFSLSGVEEDKKGKKQKKKRKRSGSSSGSSSSASSSGWSSDSRGKKRRSKKGQKEKKRRSGSRSSRDQTTDQAQPRALSPFSQKMQLQQQQQQPFGVAQGMNLPAEYSRGGSLERPVSAAGSNVLPPGEDALPFTPPKKETMDSNQEQMPDLSKPPPSFPAPVSTYEYNPVFPPAQQAQSVSESTYDQAVREFLEKTTGRPPPSSMFDTRIRSRDMDKDRDRERDRDREKERPRRGARESRRRSPTPTPRNREQRRSFSETTKAPVVAKTPPEKEEPVPDSTSSKKSVRKKSRRRSSSSSSSSSFSSSSEEDEKAKKKKKEKSVGTGKKVASSKAAKKNVKKKKDPVTDAATKEEMKKKAKMIAELASMGVNTDMEEFAAKLAGYMKGSKDKGLYCSFGFLIQDNF